MCQEQLTRVVQQIPLSRRYQSGLWILLAIPLFQWSLNCSKLISIHMHFLKSVQLSDLWTQRPFRAATHRCYHLFKFFLNNFLSDPFTLRLTLFVFYLRP